MQAVLIHGTETFNDFPLCPNPARANLRALISIDKIPTALTFSPSTIFSLFNLHYHPSFRLLTPSQLRIGHINGMLLQTLIKLKQTTDQEGPAPPKRAQACLILSPAMGINTKAGTKREANAAHQIPKADVPAQCTKRRFPPPMLRLKHEQGARHNEAGATNDLGNPVGAVEGRGSGEPGEDGWQSGDAGNPEDGRAEELEGRGDEAELVQVVVTQVAPGWKPHPGFALGTVVGAVFGLLLREFVGGLLALLAFSHQV